MPTPFETFVNDELPNRIASQESSQTAGYFPRYTGAGKLTTERSPSQVSSDIDDGRYYRKDEFPNVPAVLISPTAPINPPAGQAWLDTSAPGTPGLGVLNFITITTDLTLNSSHTVVFCDATAGPIVVTVPAASAHNGRLYSIVKIDSSVNTVTMGGGFDAILTVQDEAVPIMSDASDWRIPF